MFDINLATSPSAIQQLIDSYFAHWNNDYISELYELWYNVNTINNAIVSGRMYYKRLLQSNPNNILYWNAYFTYDTQTNLYTYQGGSGSYATANNNGLTQNELNQLVSYYSTIPTIPICFPSGTPLLTDQGIIHIEKINPAKNTIRGKKIVAITKTITIEDKIVCIEKDAFGPNIPSQKTLISRNHKLFYNKQMIKAKHLIGKVDGIYNKKYNGEVLYNVLLDTHEKMLVNNLIVETLDPENIVAKLYNGNYTDEERNNIIVNINQCVNNYKNVYGKLR